ncbi:MAG: hypothetical protein J0L75_08240 [Spirochaetes bacterium]|nr:hypothetical protein [Spirochaetota bacterium]
MKYQDKILFPLYRFTRSMGSGLLRVWLVIIYFYSFVCFAYEPPDAGFLVRSTRVGERIQVKLNGAWPKILTGVVDGFDIVTKVNPAGTYQTISIEGKSGGVVRSLFKGIRSNEVSSFFFDGRDDHGAFIGPGKYLVRLRGEISSRGKKNSDEDVENLIIDNVAPVLVSARPFSNQTISTNFPQQLHENFAPNVFWYFEDFDDDHDDGGRDRELTSEHMRQRQHGKIYPFGARFKDSLSGVAVATLKINEKTIYSHVFRNFPHEVFVGHVEAVNQIQVGRNLFSVSAKDRAGNAMGEQIPFFSGSIQFSFLEPTNNALISDLVSVGITLRNLVDRDRVSVVNYEVSKAGDIAWQGCSRAFPYQVLPVLQGVSDGIYQVSASVADLSGFIYRTTPVQFIRDTTPPALTLDNPVSVTIPSNQYTISGRALDANLGFVEVGNSRVAPDSLGRFSVKVSLQTGDNTICIRAVDKVSNETDKQLNITVLDQPPPVVSGLTSTQDAMSITFRWQSNTEATISKYLIRRVPPFPASRVGLNGNGQMTVYFGQPTLLNDPVAGDGARPGDEYTYSIRAVDSFGRQGEERSLLVKFGTVEVTVRGGETNVIQYGNATVTILPDSLPSGSAEVLSISKSTAPLNESSVIGASEIFLLGPNGTVFQNPVLMTLKYNTSQMPQGYTTKDLRMFVRASPGQPWSVLKTQSIDPMSGSITAYVSHFSEFTAGFLSAPKDSQTRFNVNTKLPEFKIPDPLSGRPGLGLPNPNIYGNLNQEIPIVLPPGREGIAPQVSVSYSSMRENGVIGWGWGISKSAISRSSDFGLPTFSADVTKDKVLYNGQEIAFISNNLATGDLIYRQKQESSFLLFQYTPSSDSWRVIKDGVSQIFGGDGNSRRAGRSVDGTTGTSQWFLAQHSRFDEVIAYTYVDLGGSTEIQAITYAANRFRIDFTYEARGDIVSTCGSGIVGQISQRLSKFSIYDQATSLVIRDYVFSYGTDEGGNSQLTNASVVSSKTSTTLYDYVFSYHPFSFSFAPEANFSAPGSATYDEFRKTFRDVNGDGIVDLLINLEGHSNFASGQWAVFTNNGASFSSTPIFLTLKKSGQRLDVPFERLQFLDLNGDKRVDVLADLTGFNGISVSGTSWSIFTNDGNGFTWTSEFTSDINSDRVKLLDANGDGRPDVIADLDGYTASVPTWSVFTNTLGGFDPTPFTFTGPSGIPGSRVSFMDMNGDGKPDLVVDNTGLSGVTEGSYDIYINTGVNFLGSSMRFQGPVADSWRKSFVDMDGDGLPDLLVKQQGIIDGQYLVYRNQGICFDTNPVTLSVPTLDPDRVQFVDVNEDGRPDIKIDKTGVSGFNDGDAEIYLNTYSNGVLSCVYWGVQSINADQLWRVSRMDINADGRQDIVFNNDGNVGQGPGSYSARLRAPSWGPLLASATYNKSTQYYVYDRLSTGLGVPQTILATVGISNHLAATSPDFFKSETHLSYANFKYDFANRHYYGFSEVTAEDVLGNRSVSIFAQNQKETIGRPIRQYKLVWFNGALTTNSVKENTWDVALVHNGLSSLALLSETRDITNAPDNGESLTNATQYRYFGLDPALNDEGSGASGLFLLAEKLMIPGDVVTNADAVVERYAYQAIVSPNYIPQISFIESRFWGNSGTGDILRREAFDYDSTARLSTKRVWNGGSGLSESIFTNTFTYIPSSSVTNTVTDARGVVSKYSFTADRRFNLSQTNTLGDFSIWAVDDIWGMTTNGVNTRGETNYYQFDEYQRLASFFGPKDPLIDLPARAYEYGENGATFWAKLKYKKFFSGAHLAPGEKSVLETIAFVDGMGRELQTKVRKDLAHYVLSGKKYYDNAGRPTNTFDPVLAADASVAWDEYVDPQDIGDTAFSTWVVYDDFGRVTNQARGGIVTKRSFTGLFESRVTDPRGNLKRSLKDKNGNTVRVEDWAAGSIYASIDYSFDFKGNLTNTHDTYGNNIRLFYDELSRKTNMTDPDMGVWSYSFDIYGRMTELQDAKGNRILFGYDERDRLTNKAVTSGPSYSTTNILAQYEYGTNRQDDLGTSRWGRLLQVQDESGIESYIYNEIGDATNAVKITSGGTYETGYEHDALGRIRHLIYPHTLGTAASLIVRYVYDPDNGLLTQIGAVSDTSAAQGVFGLLYMNGIDYDNFGRRRNMTYGNGVSTTYAYTGDTGMLATARIARGAFTHRDLTYSFDTGGNLLVKHDYAQNIEHRYGYDALNRLSSAVMDQSGTNNYSHQYRYDSLGNIIHKDVDEGGAPTKGNRNYTYDPAHPHAVSSFVGKFESGSYVDESANFAINYDVNGNMLSQRIVSGTDANLVLTSKTMSWDSENRLKRVIVTNGNEVLTNSFAYDHTGERTEKVSGAKTIRYIAGVAQADNSGKTSYFIFDGVNRICAVNSDINGEQAFFMHTDHVGSTVLVTGGYGSPVSEGAIYQQLDYKPFGSPYLEARTLENNGAWLLTTLFHLEGVGSYSFTGQELDADTGLMYFGARYYSPEMGRFISGDSEIPDQLNTQSYTRYAYALNNPIIYSDPSGHYDFSWLYSLMNFDFSFSFSIPSFDFPTFEFPSFSISVPTIDLGGFAFNSGFVNNFGFGESGNFSTSGGSASGSLPIFSASSISSGVVNVLTQSQMTYGFQTDTSLFQGNTTGVLGLGFVDWASGTALNGLTNDPEFTLSVGLGIAVTAVAIETGLGVLPLAYGMLRYSRQPANFNTLGVTIGELGVSLEALPGEVSATSRVANSGATLPGREIVNFLGRPSQVTIGEGEILYGIRDVGSRNLWWTRTEPMGELQWRMDLAVKPKWNKGTHLETLTVPRGQSIIGFEGSARGQDWYLGGGNQVYIPGVPSGWSTLVSWGL